MNSAAANLTMGPISGLSFLGSATAFPSDLIDPKHCVLSNSEFFARLFGSTADQVLKERGWNEDQPLRTHGIARREWLRDSKLGSTQLALEAGRRALDGSKLEPHDIGLILVATSTPARISSSIAAQVARELGLNCAALDVRAGGVGGLAALATAATYLQAGSGSVLVIATEAISPFINLLEPGASIYGDGAAALICTRNPDFPSSLRACMTTAAVAGKAFTIPGNLPPTLDELQGAQFSFQTPDETYQEQLADIWDGAADSLRAACEPQALTHFLPYAITKTQLRRVTDRIGITAPLCRQLLETYGCTGCAAPMIALVKLHQESRLGSDSRLGMLSVGGGVHSAWILWKGPLDSEIPN